VISPKLSDDQATDDSRTLHRPAKLRARIVFSESVPEGLLIDALCTPRDGVSSPAPVCLHASLPRQIWSYFATGTLRRWATLGSEVDLKFRYHGSLLQVAISGERCNMLLDLLDWPAGLPD
jgi:hypothetical protein